VWGEGERGGDVPVRPRTLVTFTSLTGILEESMFAGVVCGGLGVWYSEEGKSFGKFVGGGVPRRASADHFFLAMVLKVRGEPWISICHFLHLSDNGPCQSVGRRRAVHHRSP